MLQIIRHLLDRLHPKNRLHRQQQMLQANLEHFELVRTNVHKVLASKPSLNRYQHIVENMFEGIPDSPEIHVIQEHLRQMEFIHQQCLVEMGNFPPVQLPESPNHQDIIRTQDQLTKTLTQVNSIINTALQETFEHITALLEVAKFNETIYQYFRKRYEPTLQHIAEIKRLEALLKS